MIVLDTHVWIWWVDDNSRLSSRVRNQIDAEAEVVVNAISMLEVATAVSLNRLVLKLSRRVASKGSGSGDSADQASHIGALFGISAAAGGISS